MTDLDVIVRRTDPALSAPWAPAVLALAERTVGALSESLRIGRLERAGRSFEVEAGSGGVTIAATDATSACVALARYLREACGVSVGWDADLPLRIARAPASPPIRAAARVRDGYYLNFCTFSYTTAYWGWPEWEREIDWMALHGITMPLAAVGHEAALHLAYSRLGMPDSEILAHLGGPGYLPFHYMGCVAGFAGPLPRSWLDTHADLGRRILERQRELGMTPVLPAFSGSVPASLAPGHVHRRSWMGFETDFLDPGHPLYRDLTAGIVRAQVELFGTDHLFAADPFIEMLPVDADPAFAADVAAATLDGLLRVDAEAAWVLQAWPFSFQPDHWTAPRVRAFLDAIPGDRLIILDLWAEADPQWLRCERFDGKRWIWCGLLNFGGRTDPIGNLPRLVESVDAALHDAPAPVGIGLAMEGIHNNAALVELTLDQAWSAVPDVGEWLDRFVAQRYGVARDNLLVRAWRGLLATVYDTPTRVAPADLLMVITARPSYDVLADPDGLRTRVDGLAPYDLAVLARSWGEMIEAAEHGAASPEGALGRDLVDVASVAMARVADRLFLDLVERSLASGAVEADALARFLVVFDDLDRLLSTRPGSTLAAWESEAAGWATTAEEESLLRDNARRILTVWDAPERITLDGYGARLWGSLVGDYYRGRWQDWADGLRAALASIPAAEEQLQARLRLRAEAFLRDGARAVHDELGDVVSESRRSFERHAHVLAAGEPGTT